MGVIQKIKKFKKEGTLFNKLVCGVLMKTNFSNEKLQAMECRNRVYCHLKKKYAKAIETINYEENEFIKEKNKNIWICWFQGMDNAPELVKKCYTSIKKYMPTSTITVITNDNLEEYVQFPKHIMEKFKKGIITYAQLSDMLRLELLTRYGGLWIDATVLLTDKIPDYVFEKRMFLYRELNPRDKTMTFNSWFIYSQKDDNVLKTIRDIMYLYWSENNKIREYFLWHLFTTLVFEKYSDRADDIYYITENDAHTLGWNIFKMHDETYWKELTRLTSVHKLSNKWDMPESVAGTNYEFIMSNKD